MWGQHVKEMPPLEGFMTIPLAVDIRFHKWDEILKTPKPDPSMKVDDRFLALRAWHGAGWNRKSERSRRGVQGDR